MRVSDNSVLFLDVLANANFADFGDDSSIINTEVDDTTLSTSARIGYRGLTDGSAWMLGVNGGYDPREMATGAADNVDFSITPEFQTSVGDYYQKGDLGTADGYGALGQIKRHNRPHSACRSLRRGTV